MLYQEFQPLQVNLLSEVNAHSDAYYSDQTSQADMFLHTLLSPNESVWDDTTTSGPYQNHSVSMPTSYDNVYPDAYSYTMTVGVSPMESSALYPQDWSAPGLSNISAVTASPVSPVLQTPSNEESSNEPKIRRNNYSLLVHNHQFPTLEAGLPP